MSQFGFFSNESLTSETITNTIRCTVHLYIVQYLVCYLDKEKRIEESIEEYGVHNIQYYTIQVCLPVSYLSSGIEYECCRV